MAAPQISDEDALAAAAGGDGRAFEVVFERYAAPGYRYAAGLLADSAAAEDAVQDAFAKLFAHARNGGFDPNRGTARGLFFRMVRNACVDRLRDPRSRAVPLESARGTPTSPADAAGLRADVEAALARLPEGERSALILRAEGGLSYSEIASSLGATVGQVKTWIFRGRRRLARALDLAPRPGSGGGDGV